VWEKLSFNFKTRKVHEILIKEKMEFIIETEDLGKHYREVKAVEHLSLRVKEGEIYSFLGLNGAGKTTTIRMLLGMIKPTTGYADVLGTRVKLGSIDPWKDVGYLVETPKSYSELTVRENLEVARRLHPGTSQQAVSKIIDRLGLSEYTDRRAGNLSLGNVQRLGLAKALIHQPKLIFLDEPANGLDPAGIVEIRELLLELTRDQGATVFMSSHILAEVARLAQRIGIIHQGHLLQELNVDELERNRNKRLLLKTSELQTSQQVLTKAGYSAEVLVEGQLELKQPRAVEHPDEINSLLVKSGNVPTQLMVEEEELEHYFLRLVGMDGGLKNEKLI
jgi:ABC-2 type transport system ATP-binding protein